MNEWIDLYKEILEKIRESGGDILFFRGHCDTNWKLMPTLGRFSNPNISQLEEVTYFDFQTRAGSLLSEHNSSWNNAFAMQHHGLPTRLLDWSENFSTALYFALKNASQECCIWILNPFELNRVQKNNAELFRPTDLEGTYDEYFISKEKHMNEKVLAISPLRHHPRVFNQRAGFTIHNELNAPLEDIFPKVVKKIVIPRSAQEGASQFLKLAGVSEFTLFPDLDGLARELNSEHFSR
ncbi:FRG domain-containing protein [Undibacterium sp. Ji50W]|uniref:FRG domain-containing protein n=1 Tax=Undibacterium sp. Ji50W TaxID=3413041 RepID=UPI003BF04026